MRRRLTRLVLQGYKTFVSKTEFEFGDVTCIVGPNGSGKSNIADALRWVLGEQSYQLLRGRKTEDMIFSGSEKRAKASMAAVSVVFDNSDGWLPIDFSEVSLTRRAYRDGRNEYLLNGNKARLRDIADLLGKVGLARRTYTIIGQGLVDTALSLKADERRALFEEAAGIGMYRQKREESLRKLEATQRNIERVQDIMAEISPRLNTLERQAKRAGDHRQTQKKFRDKFRLWYGYHWHHVQSLVLASSLESNTRAEELADLRGLQASDDEQLSRVRTQISEQRSKLDFKLGEAAAKRHELEAVRRKLAVANERSRNVEKHQLSTSTQLEQFGSMLDGQRQQLSEARSEVARLDDEHAEIQHQISAAQEGAERGEQERSAVADRESGYLKRVTDITQQITEVHARRTALQDRLEQLAEEGTGLDRALSMGRTAVEQLQDTLVRKLSIDTDQGDAREAGTDDQGSDNSGNDGIGAELTNLVGRVLEALSKVEILTSRREQQVDKQLSVLESRLEELEEERRVAEKKASLERARLEEFTPDELASRISGLRISLAVTSRSLQDRRDRCGELSDAFERDERLLQARQEQTASLSSELGTLSQDIEDLTQRESMLQKQFAAIEDKIDPLRADIDTLEIRIGQDEGGEAESRALLHSAERRCSEAELEHERKQSQLASLRQQINEDFSLVDVESSEGVEVPAFGRDSWMDALDRLDLLPEGLESEIELLRVRLRRMGRINTEVVSEHHEVKKRYEHLETEINDLESASEHLQEVIVELDALMQRDFHKTFEAVANEFQYTFERLFGGGKADLELTNPEDLSRAGIEIVAQLPGRRRQGLALLSGGERSLTACALVFALLRISPTPFAMLDEVDAMLDEANVGRFREILAEIGQNTQFVVITHNRHTVEVADTVYGVSMGTDSASQVISLRLD